MYIIRTHTRTHSHTRLRFAMWQRRNEIATKNKQTKNQQHKSPILIGQKTTKNRFFFSRKCDNTHTLLLLLQTRIQLKIEARKPRYIEQAIDEVYRIFLFPNEKQFFFFRLFFPLVVGSPEGNHSGRNRGVRNRKLDVVVDVVVVVVVVGSRCAQLAVDRLLFCLFVFYPTNNNIQIKQKRRASNVKSLSIIVVFFFASSDLEVGGPFFFWRGGRGGVVSFLFFCFYRIGGRAHTRAWGTTQQHDRLLLFFFFFRFLRRAWVLDF